MLKDHAGVVATVTGETSKPESWDLHVIAYSGTALLLASAFGNGLNYAFGILVARALGAEQFGIYALAVTMFNMLTLAVVCGMDTGAVKFISSYLTEGEHDRVRKVIVTSASIAFLTGLVTAIGLAAVARPLSVAVYGKPELVLSLLFFAAVIPAATVANVLLSSLQAFQTVRYTIFIKYLWEPIAKFLFTAALVLAGFQLLGVLISIALTFIFSVAWSIYAVYRFVFSGRREGLTWDRREARALFGYCVPLTISTAFSVGATRSDILILGYWADTQQVGVYLAAFQTAAIMSLVLGAFDKGLAPIISRAWNQQDNSRMIESYQGVSRLCTTVSLPIFCCLMLFADQILLIFGPSFVSGGAALIILALGQIFNNVTGGANTILLMSGHSRLVMRNSIIMGMILLVTTAILIPLWGITGAAVAASATFLITNTIRVLQVWRLHNMHPYTWHLAKPVTAAVFASASVWVLQKGIMLLPVVGLVGIFCTVYCVALLALGFNSEDRLVLQSIVGKVIG